MDFTIPLKYIAIRLTAADYVEITESQLLVNLIDFRPALRAAFSTDLLFV
jgi:hypothetical protein